MHSMGIKNSIALGYKADYIIKYFNNFNSEWKINLIDTGIDTQTEEM